MFCSRYEEGTLKRAQNIAHALDFYGGTAAFVGGGGKSTSIARLARALVSRSASVIITTTTHIKKPSSRVFDGQDLPALCSVLSMRRYATVGINDRGRRLSYPGDVVYGTLRDVCDALLVEADGAHCLPFKAPEEWEPVLPEGLDLVVGVAGVDALFRRIGTACHRPERVATICGKSIEDILLPEDMARVLMSEQGTCKNVNCRYEVLLNKADDHALRQNAILVAQALDRPCIITGRKG